MHSDTHILVTHFCNPDLFSNSHGLLSAYLQYKSKKKKTSQTLKRKFLRFLSKQNLNSVSPAKVGGTVHATLIKTEANPVTGESADLRLVCFAQAQNLPQSISPVLCAVKSYGLHSEHLKYSSSIRKLPYLSLDENSLFF